MAVGSADQISSSLFQFFNKSKSALKGPSDLDPTANDVLTARNTNPNNKPFGIFQPVRQNNLELCFVQAHFQLNECHRYLRISELCSRDPLAYPQLIVASPLLHNLITKPTLKDTETQKNKIIC